MKLKFSIQIRIAFRLLILQYYQRLGEELKSKRFERETKRLIEILAPIF